MLVWETMEHEILKTKVLILGAGKGKRMQSELPKVLASLSGKPMIRHVLESVYKAINGKPVVIVGHKKELVEEELGDEVLYAVQDEQLGTGHAVVCAKEYCENFEHIIVLSGDQPLISSETIRNLITKHSESVAKVTFATTIVEDFEDWRKGFMGFGRILRENGKVIGIKEFKDSNEEEKNIKEVNAGSYIFNGPWLWENLNKLKNENAQGEYYLTDLLHLASSNGEIIETISIGTHEALGANTKEELETLNALATSQKYTSKKASRGLLSGISLEVSK